MGQKIVNVTVTVHLVKHQAGLVGEVSLECVQFRKMEPVPQKRSPYVVVLWVLHLALLEAPVGKEGKDLLEGLVEKEGKDLLEELVEKDLLEGQMGKGGKDQDHLLKEERWVQIHLLPMNL